MERYVASVEVRILTAKHSERELHDVKSILATTQRRTLSDISESPKTCKA